MQILKFESDVFVNCTSVCGFGVCVCVCVACSDPQPQKLVKLFKN